jgi:SAM-dependent methyltransferase
MPGRGLRLARRYARTVRGVVVEKLASATGRVAERAVELRHGVRTAERVALADLGVDERERVSHHASSWIALHGALERLEPGRDDVFADVGSGLGRGLVVAARFAFRRVIGVEVSAELTERARANLARSRVRRRAGAVELVTADALHWQIPPDLTVAYLYCPFTGSSFERFAARLLESVERHPRPLRVLYNYPLEHNALLRAGRVRVLDVVAARWPASPAPTDRIVTYQLLPADAELASELARPFEARVRDPVWSELGS